MRIAKIVVFYLLLCLPILIFLAPFLLRSNGILPGDWDYFAQLYEAARISIIDYNQFPWFNPWIGGGVPLYANPQFGLISIQTPLVLVFGTLAGLRLAVFVYFIIGFWGMRNLLLRVGSDKIMAILLSYIWVFSSFPVWRLAGGHFTFGAYFLAPWFFYLLLNIRKPLGWLWVGLITALLMNQSLHYMTVHILLIGSVIALFQFITLYRKRKFSLWKLLQPYVYSGLVLLPLATHKLYFTLQYLHDFPRTPPVEAAVPMNIITAALTFRGSQVFDPTLLYKGGFGWSEYASYFGLLTLALFAYLILKKLEKPRLVDSKLIVLFFGLLLVLLLSLGDFGSLSPYALLKQLPVFDQMQVASRWLGWFVFGIIIALSRLPRTKVIVAILVISLIDVFFSSYNIINYNLGTYTEPKEKSIVLNQQSFYKNTSNFSTDSLRLLHATQSNIGDIYGYEPLVGFGNIVNEGYAGLSNRCSNKTVSCDFVTSNNARVLYWSPNYIKLERTGSGNIILNENPGSYWKVNSKYPYKTLDVISLKQDFIIRDGSNSIDIHIDPTN